MSPPGPLPAPYRSPAEREPPAVIDFRHVSPWWPVAVTAFLTVAIVLFSHRVVLHCERAFDGSGFCRARDEHLFWRSQSEPFDLGGVRGAQLLSGYKRATRVALVATHSTIELTPTGESSSGDEKRAFIASFESFLADRSATTFDAAYGSRWSQHLLALLFVAPIAIGFGAFTRRVRVVVDGGSGSVCVQRSRFPFAANEEDYLIDEVRGAEVEEGRSSKGQTTYRVALVLAGGTRVPLTTSYSTWRVRKARVVEQIREALRVHGP
jgi:hypothetical protein